jgi:hypothetical protein
MTRDETVALFLECEAKRRDARVAARAEGKSKDEASRIAHEAAKAHWNAWAAALLAERKAMEADRHWTAEKDRFGNLAPQNAAPSAWMEKATADFSRCLFLLRGAEGTKEAVGEEEDSDSKPSVKLIELDGSSADFSGFLFPADASFESATFSGYARFGSAAFSGYARFGNATFTGDASFGSATFSGYARFDSATYLRYARFESAAFSGYARFGNATFTGDASFESATFSGYASFGSATFSSDASFGSATFSGYASFESATFSGGSRFGSATFSGYASFGSATFSGDASFESATFSGDAWFGSATFQNSTNCQEAAFEKKTSFTGIKVDRTFDMTGAKFKQVPAFNQADFKQTPDLDKVEFPLPFFWGDAELIAKYRAIRRMAMQGADYEREQMAFKGELRSRRWTTDKWWHLGTWFGLLYDLLADCGRSIVRPMLLWQASVVFFAILYTRLADQGGEGWSRCVGEGGAPFIKALFLSGRNALVLFSGGRDARITQAYRCLYGGDGEPHIPDSVSFLEAFVQVPVSAVLIFLLLLAIKNRFKIK